MNTDPNAQNATAGGVNPAANTATNSTGQEDYLDKGRLDKSEGDHMLT